MIELELLRSGRAYYGVKELGNAVRAKEERERERRRFYFLGKFGNLGISWQYKQEDVARVGLQKVEKVVR